MKRARIAQVAPLLRERFAEALRRDQRVGSYLTEAYAAPRGSRLARGSRDRSGLPSACAKMISVNACDPLLVVRPARPASVDTATAASMSTTAGARSA